MVSFLLIALAVACGLSLLAALLALVIFPWFRSGERKPGVFRPDQSTGGMPAVVVTGRRRRRVQPRSTELPLVGGVAMVIATLSAAIGAGIWLNFSGDNWTLLGILLASLVGFGAVGFLDDWQKVYHGQGITERTKFIGVVLVSLAAAIALNRLVPSARFAYSPYADVPVLGSLLRHTHYIWVIFFILMTVTVSSTTSLAVDFSDGLDGLAGGLLVSAALAFGIIILSEQGEQNWPAALLLTAMVGALLGYLPLNWPSSFKAHGEGRGRRRARLIMGDTGSLAFGGTLALVTVITRNELLLIVVGGVFLLEGISALVSARILVKFFRGFLYLPRFGNQPYAHTEFPLPFLATPMHHHYDLLGWDRQRLVYGAWTLGAALATLGIASTIAPFTWERYLARLVALIVLIGVWQMGPWSRQYFIGVQSGGLLGLYYGFPYQLFGHALYARVDSVAIDESAIQTPAERLGLWQRTSVYDARGILGSLCYRAGALEDAIRVWSKIPSRNLEVRPQVRDMLADARHRKALEADGFAEEEAASLLARPAVNTRPSTYVPPEEDAAPPAEPRAPASALFEPALNLATPDGSFPFAVPNGQFEHDLSAEPGPPPYESAQAAPAPAETSTEMRPHALNGAAAEPQLLASQADTDRSDAYRSDDANVAPSFWTLPDPLPAAAPTESPWGGQTQSGLRAARLEPVNPATAGGIANTLKPPTWGSHGWSGNGQSAPDPTPADGRDDAPRSPGSPDRW